MKIIGIILVSALLVIPGAAASQITDRYIPMLAIAVAVALTSTVGGLLFSYYADLAPNVIQNNMTYRLSYIK